MGSFQGELRECHPCSSRMGGTELKESRRSTLMPKRALHRHVRLLASSVCRRIRIVMSSRLHCCRKGSSGAGERASEEEEEEKGRTEGIRKGARAQTDGIKGIGKEGEKERKKERKKESNT